VKMTTVCLQLRQRKRVIRGYNFNHDISRPHQSFIEALRSNGISNNKSLEVGSEIYEVLSLETTTLKGNTRAPKELQVQIYLGRSKQFDEGSAETEIEKIAEKMMEIFSDCLVPKHTFDFGAHRVMMPIQVGSEYGGEPSDTWGEVIMLEGRMRASRSK
jgi:hypothetical protein